MADWIGAYDAEGARSRRSIRCTTCTINGSAALWSDGNQGSAATQATYFAYDQGQIVLEFAGSTAASLLTRYLWSPAVDRLLAEEAHVKQGITTPTWSQPGITFWASPTTWVPCVTWQVYGYPAGSGMPSQQTHLVKHREYDAYGRLLREWNRGDYNGDRNVNATDIDLLRDAINAGSTNLAFDLTGNGTVSQPSSGFGDMDELVLIILNTYYGDSNLDVRRQLPADLVSHFPPQVTEDHQPARLYYRAGGLGASRALQLKMSVTEGEAQRLLEHYRERGIAELHGWPADPDAERFIPDESTTLYPTDMTEVPPHLLTADESAFILVGSEPKDPDPFYCGGVVISPKNRTVRYFAETDHVK